MDYNNCTIEMELTNGKKACILSSDGVTSLHAPWNSAYDMTGNANEVYKMATGLWEMVGVHVTKHVTKCYSHAPEWDDIPNLSITLKAKVWEIEEHEEGSRTTWLLELDRPVNQIVGATKCDDNYENGLACLTEEFEAILAYNLYDYGFQWGGGYVHPGDMFVSTYIHWQPHSRRVIVINRWLRDV